jgi:tetratricopeptide (TPR) repeat protein
MLGPPKQKLQGWLLLTLITMAAMGLYLARGSPRIPSAPALFETEGPRFEQRQLVKKERELTRASAAAPEDASLLFELGALRMQNGRLEEAIAVLSAAHDKDPAREDITTKLGAAHYAAALAAFFLEDNREQAQKHFDKALEIAPKDAPYREKLLQDIKKFQEEA